MDKNNSFFCANTYAFVIVDDVILARYLNALIVKGLRT